MSKSGSTKNPSQFNALLTIVNDSGFIIGNCFTKTESLREEKVSALLKEVFDQNRDLNEVLTDNCCKDSKVLEDISGRKLRVRLDIFHAINRITRQLKKNSFSEKARKLMFIRAVRLMIRAEDDHGFKRLKSTADDDTIRRNIDNVIKEFGSDLPKDVKEQLLQLKNSHSVCLSGIAAHRGTHLNEASHRRINQRFSRHRIVGIDVAEALLNTMSYRYNIKNGAHFDPEWEVQVMRGIGKGQIASIGMRNEIPLSDGCTPTSTKFDDSLLMKLMKNLEFLSEAASNMESNSLQISPKEILLYHSFNGLPQMSGEMNNEKISKMCDTLGLESGKRAKFLLNIIQEVAGLRSVKDAQQKLQSFLLVHVEDYSDAYSSKSSYKQDVMKLEKSQKTLTSLNVFIKATGKFVSKYKMAFIDLDTVYLTVKSQSNKNSIEYRISI